MNCSDLIVTLLTDTSKSSLSGTITARELSHVFDGTTRHTVRNMHVLPGNIFIGIIEQECAVHLIVELC